MNIYVVKPGDSLYSIARKYRVNPNKIYDINKLEDFKYLVPGQALVIPTNDILYVVKPGDSLWSISKKFNVPIQSIINNNPLINPTMIYPGEEILIPGKDKRYGNIEVNAYIEPIGSEAEMKIINDVGEYLTFISPFSYQLREDGNLIPMKDESILKYSKAKNVKSLLTVTNTKGGAFDSELIDKFLKNEDSINKFIENTLRIMKEKGYYGLKLDIERIPTEDRELYNNFLRKVTNKLHQENYIVSTALAPKTSGSMEGPWYGGHDYKAHGEIVDFVVLMTYEWGWSGGPPMAVAPVPQVRKVLDYAVSVIPRKKILMGMPLYGYDWTLPYVRGGKWAKRLSPQDAIKLAIKHGQNIRYDYKSLAPFYYYYDNNGTKHVVWFEDARSVDAKLKLINEYSLRGNSYWVLGLDFPQNWALLDDRFNIKKD